MKPAGKDGKLYSIAFKEAVTGGASVTLDKSGFYKIKSIASSASSLPTKDRASPEARASKSDKSSTCGRDKRLPQAMR